MSNQKLTRAELLRALKDVAFRATLTPEQRAQLVETPLCTPEVEDSALDRAAAGFRMPRPKGNY